jgi:hypothetical protein
MNGWQVYIIATQPTLPTERLPFLLSCAYLYVPCGNPQALKGSLYA